MRFAPTTEQRDFAASLRDLLAAADVPGVVRAWAAGDPAPLRKVWGRLAEAGVLALGLDEATAASAPPGRSGHWLRGTRPRRRGRPAGRVGGGTARPAGRNRARGRWPRSAPAA